MVDAFFVVIALTEATGGIIIIFACNFHRDRGNPLEDK